MLKLAAFWIVAYGLLLAFGTAVDGVERWRSMPLEQIATGEQP